MYTHTSIQQQTLQGICSQNSLVVPFANECMLGYAVAKFSFSVSRFLDVDKTVVGSPSLAKPDYKRSFKGLSESQGTNLMYSRLCVVELITGAGGSG